MIDHFALLGESRRPWLEEGNLKAKFISTAAALHPDRVHTFGSDERLAANQRYTELNAAYQCLRDPKSRLLHLLELERGAKPKEVQRIPPEVIGLFSEVTRWCRDTDAFLAETARSTSPVLRATAFELGLQHTEKLRELSVKLRGSLEALHSELMEMNRLWEFPEDHSQRIPSKSQRLDRLEEIYRKLSFLNRWSEQIQTRLIKLASF